MQPKSEDLENAVALLLRQGPLTPDDVSTKLGISWGTAQNVLLRLTSKGMNVGLDASTLLASVKPEGEKHHESALKLAAETR